MQLVRTAARTIIPLALAAFVATGCDGGTAFGGIPDNAICAVDGTAIRKAEFDRMWSNAKQGYEDQQRDFPKKGTAEYDDLRNQLVDYMVQQTLVENQAEKFGLSVSDKDIEKGVKDLKQQVAQGDEKQFEKEMDRVGYTIEQVRKDVEFDALSKKLYERVVKDVKVSDKEAQKYYDENQDQFTTKESRNVAHILVKDKAKAQQIYDQVRSGDEKAFAKAAKANSTDPGSKDNGGDLGDIQRGQTVPEFDKVAFDLKTGEVSEPVKSDFGWHVIFAKGDVKPESKQKFSEAKDEIKKQLKGQQEGERYTEWNKDVRKDAEDDVDCRKGYTWTQTQTEDEKAKAQEKAQKQAEADAEADGDDEAEGDDAKGDDAKADDAKADGDAKAADDAASEKKDK
jgi:foldase protein PrsA